MAAEKVTDRPVLPVVEPNDIIHVVDVSDLTDGPAGTSKQTTAQAIADLGGGGGGGGGHVIREEGVDLPAQNNLNFAGLFVTATDNPGGAETLVTINPARITDSRVNIVALRDAGNLIPGAWYEVNDALDQFLAFLPPEFAGMIYKTSVFIEAMDANTLGSDGVILGINADHQQVGDYTGIAGTVGNKLGSWYKSYIVDVDVTDRAGQSDAFRPSQRLENTTLGNEMTIVERITELPAFPGIGSFQVRVEEIDPQSGAGIWAVGNSLTSSGTGAATITAITEQWTPAVDDIVIWNNNHYRSKTAIMGDFPATDATNWELVTDNTDLTSYKESGHILEYDRCLYDIDLDYPLERVDKRGNIAKISPGFTFGFGFPISTISAFKWGHDETYSNTHYDILNISMMNQRGRWSGNRLKAMFMGAIYLDNSDPQENFINDCIFENADLSDVAVQGGSQMSFCDFNDGNVDGNILQNGARMENCTTHKGGNISSMYIVGSQLSNVVASGQLSSCDLLEDPVSAREGNMQWVEIHALGAIRNAVIRAGLNASAFMEQITIHTGCDLLDFSLDATGPNNNNVKIQAVDFIGACTCSRWNFTDEAHVTDSIIGHDVEDFVLTGTTQQYEFLEITKETSNLPYTYDITGLTTIDLGAVFAEWAGRIDLITTNPGETITAFDQQSTKYQHGYQFFGQGGKEIIIESGENTNPDIRLIQDTEVILRGIDDSLTLRTYNELRGINGATYEVRRFIYSEREGYAMARLVQADILTLGTVPFKFIDSAGGDFVIWPQDALTRWTSGNYTVYTAGVGGTLDMEITSEGLEGNGSILQDTLTLGVSGTGMHYVTWEKVPGDIHPGAGLTVQLKGGIDPASGGDPTDSLILVVRFKTTEK